MCSREETVFRHAAKEIRGACEQPQRVGIFFIFSQRGCRFLISGVETRHARALARTLKGILRSGCATSGSTWRTGLTRVRKRSLPVDMTALQAQRRQGRESELECFGLQGCSLQLLDCLLSIAPAQLQVC